MYKLIIAITILSMASCQSNLNKLVFNKVAELKEQHQDKIKPVLKDTLETVGMLMVEGGMCVQNVGAGLLVVDDAVQHWGQWGQDLFDLLFAALYEHQAWEQYCAPLFNSTSTIEQLLKIPFEHKQQFSTFKSDHGKTYETLSEEANRLLIFSQNLQYINEFNSNIEDNDIVLGINEFADLTHEEFKAQYVGGVMPKKERNVVLLDESNNADSIDWVTQGAVNPVQNQGQCGSCWAFSAVAAMEAANYIDQQYLLKFSEQQLVDCAASFGNNGCQGGLMDHAFEYAQVNKMDLEMDYKYVAKEQTCTASQHTGSLKLKSLVDVLHNSVSQMEAAVTKTVVSIAIEADQSAFQFYRSGVLTGTCGQHLDHGVAVVGYGTENGLDYWKVRNSWGASWGEEGYVRIHKSDANLCGVLSNPSYPVV